MINTSIYQDIAVRAGGDIYIGVVGPVRSGKSTFIKKLEEVFSSKYKIYVTREPSDTEFGNYVRTWLTLMKRQE